MFNIVDKSSEIFEIFDNDKFNLDKWEDYMDKYLPSIKDICLEDMKAMRSTEYSWDSYFLPVLNELAFNKERIIKLSSLFQELTFGLEERIIELFSKCFEVDLILYLGLCNGAGWVIEVNNRTVVLFGIEKILELNWDNVDDMRGLIFHELGHVYQGKYGVLNRDFNNSEDGFLWQLFTEGVAMVFEQEIVGDSNYYHQDKYGWKDWCDENIKVMAMDFEKDYKTMTRYNQRYFGDWAIYKNHSDVGYYLATRFVRFILKKDSFDNIITYNPSKVKGLFCDFIISIQLGQS